MKKRYRSWISIAALLAALASSRPARGQAAAGEGTRAVDKANRTVRELLRRQAAPGSPEERKLAAEVTRSVRGFLDIDTLGREAMRDHWGRLEPRERRQFLALLRGLVEANYIKALRANLDYQVRSLGEQPAAGGRLLVRTEVAVERRGRPRAIAIDYLLVRDGGRWRAADVVTDGVGLVENYRAQFNTIIARDGLAGLLDRMRKKRAAM